MDQGTGIECNAAATTDDGEGVRDEGEEWWKKLADAWGQSSSKRSSLWS